MCAAVSTTLLLVFMVICYMRAVSEGLPLNWQELRYQDDIIAGAEFLSIFLRSRLQEATQMAVDDRQQNSLSTTLETILDNDLIDYPDRELMRHSRSTSFLTAPISQPLITATPPQISTSVSNDRSSENNLKTSTTNNVDKILNTQTSAYSTTEIYSAIVSEERPSLFAEANRSDFSVEEGEPSIAHTTSTATVQEYPSTETTNPPQSLSYSTPQRTVNPQNFVYHNYPERSEQGSVSFSSVIQELPQQTILSSWNIEKPVNGDYKSVTTLNVNNSQTGTATTNTYYNEKPSVVIDQDNNMMAPTKNREDSIEQTNPPNWQLQTNIYSSARPTSRGPIVYGKPEQNYEVDESVSIMTNGRTHGVQDINPAVPPSIDQKSPDAAADPNGQKVGYVVEGRNFRKYRVEEKTSDGFIVGEYGVVSHNDGSLRGVRYTADSTINPRVIYDALMKFLSL